MADLIFKISPNIILGSYTVSRLPQYLKPFGQKFMIILDPVLKDVGLRDKILQPLAERNVGYFIYDAISDGANAKEIEQELSLARQGHIHGIIAVGGAKALHSGSVVAALFNENQNKSVYDFLDGEPIVENPIPLICLPTTYLAPHTLTSSIPVIDSRNRHVKMLKTQNSICKLMLWDPNLSLTLTESQKTSFSLETLCLATESYISQKANFFSDMFVEKATELIGYGINGSPSMEITTPAETLLEQAGAMASLASATSSTGIAGLLSLTINARYRISRSLVASILFPFIIEDSGKFKAEKIEKIGRLFGVVPAETHREEAVQMLAENIRQQMAKANLPVRLKDLNLTMEQLAIACEDAGQLDIMNSLPKSMTTDELFELARSAF